MKPVRSILSLVLLLMAVGCSPSPRPPAEVKKAVEAGLAQIDRVDGGEVVLHASVLMTDCLPRVRKHWEEAEALLNKSTANQPQHTELRTKLKNALTMCREYEDRYKEGGLFIGILESSDFETTAKDLAQAFSLKLKPPRQPTDNEPWLQPEKLHIQE